MSFPKGYNPQDLPGQIVDEGYGGRIVDPGTGAGLFTSNTDYNVVGVDPLTGETSPIGTDMGFGAAVRRWIQAGVYNGDFAVSPNAPGTPIEDAYNMLPYWSFQPTQSGQIIAYVESQDFQAFQTDAFEVTAFTAATDTSAGLTQLRFQMIPGGYAADDAYLTQLVPVTTTADEVFELEAGFTLLEVSDTDANAKAYITVEFLQANLLASTASPSSTTIEASLATDVTSTTRAPVITIPDDAAYARLKVGMRRGTAAVTAAAEFAISEVFVFQRERYDGTLFPTNPSIRQRFYRTDIASGMWFRWNGTYWLSEHVFAFSDMVFYNHTGTAAWSRYHSVPFADVVDGIFMEEWRNESYRTDTNGYYSYVLQSRVSTNTLTTRVSLTTEHTAATWKREQSRPQAYYDDVVAFKFDAPTYTGTASTLSLTISWSYRLAKTS